MKLKKNINTRGRIIRLIGAVALLAYFFIYKSYTALFVSIFVFFEAAMSWCILYQILGKNDCCSAKKTRK